MEALRAAWAHGTLGNALYSRGEPEEALTAYRKTAELFARQDSAFARQWGAYAQEQIHRIQTLENVLSGRQRAESSAEWAAALTAGYHQRRYREIVTLTERTLQTDPELTGESWGIYNSACAAARRAADPAEPSAAERSRLRGLARAWLAREVERWTGWAREGGQHAAEARRQLAHAMQDPDFASARDKGFQKLPPVERGAWQELWNMVGQSIGK